MWGTCVWAPRKGDGLADLGLGIGGGGMSINVLSWSASGDTELVCSESVVPGVADDDVGSAGNGSCCCSCSAASTNSLSTCSFMSGVEAVFFRCGLVIGDCRTLDFPFLGALFLAFFVVSAEPVMKPPRGELSMLSFTGLVVIERCVCSYDTMLSFCACNAGDVKGLKYAPGTVNWASIGKCVSSGVTAGDTSGVNSI